MKPVKRISWIFILLLILVACTNKKEIETKKLAKIYVDLLIVQDYYAGNDSLQLKREEVFQKYSLTESLYDSAFKALEHDKEEWELFFELGNNYLDSLKGNYKSVTSK